MAFIPLMTSSAGFEELLTQLAPNSAPAEPSIWPLAVGYWLIISAVICIVVVVYFWSRQQRLWWTLQAELKQLQAINDKSKQLLRLHELVRWLSVSKAANTTHLSSAEFAQWLAKYNNDQIPSWLNRHYQPSTDNVTIDWQEVSTLLRAIYKGGKS